MAGSRIPDVMAAAVTALRADASLSTLLGGAKVYTHVPQGADAPFVALLGGDEVPWGVTFTEFADITVSNGGDNGGRACDVLAQCVSAYRGTEQVDGLASQVLEVLTAPGTWSGITGFQLADFVRNSALPPTDLFGTGVLYFLRTVVVRVTVWQ